MNHRVAHPTRNTILFDTFPLKTCMLALPGPGACHFSPNRGIIQALAQCGESDSGCRNGPE